MLLSVDRHADVKKVGSNKSNLITKTISSGMWQPVHDDEWDGDTPLGLDRPLTPGKDSKGQVTFKGGALPWVTGRYEVRKTALCFSKAYLSLS